MYSVYTEYGVISHVEEESRSYHYTRREGSRRRSKQKYYDTKIYHSDRKKNYV